MTNDPSEKTYKILFVCLGNICRSPMAQAVFADLVEINGLSSHFPRIESAGTSGLHVGEAPDERTVAICRKRGVPISSHAQQLKTQDFYDYDYILGMDRENLRNIEFMMPSDAKAKVQLFAEFGNRRPIDDPYYGGTEGFNQVYMQCKNYSMGLIKYLGFNDAIPRKDRF